MSSSSNQTSREIGRLHFALYYNGLVVKVAMKAFLILANTKLNLV